MTLSERTLVLNDLAIRIARLTSDTVLSEGPKES
jgi:hypothetical protein